MGVNEDRRRIIAAQPHLVTASGSSVLVNIAEPKIERLRVTFSPVQTGSGTPSPSNVRPIMGWATIMASIGTMPVDISLGGTYYGGTVDLVSGVMTVTRAAYDLGLNPWNYLDSSLHVFNTYQGGAMRRKLNAGVNYISDVYQPYDEIGNGTTYGAAYNTMPMYSISGHMTANYSIFVRDDRASSVAQLKSLLSGHYIVYELDTPQTVQLSPQTIAALRGQQTVTSPAGAVEISYWTH